MAPVTGWYWPAEQAAQVVSPSAAAADPTPQPAHTEPPGAAWYVPWAHAMQFDDEVPPVAAK